MNNPDPGSIDEADIPEEIHEEQIAASNGQIQSEESRRYAIYQSLEEHGELSFNELAEQVADRMARNTVQKRLDEMKKDGIVEQTPSDDEWRRGQTKMFSLAPKANSALRSAINDLKVAKYDYLFGYEYDETTDQVSVREDAPGTVFITTLETYHNDSSVDHIKLCEQSAEAMLGETLYELDETDTVAEAFEKLYEQAVQVAAGKVLSQMFTASLNLDYELKKDMMMAACAEIGEIGQFWYDVWEEDWDVPTPESA